MLRGFLNTNKKQPTKNSNDEQSIDVNLDEAKNLKNNYTNLNIELEINNTDKHNEIVVLKFPTGKFYFSDPNTILDQQPQKGKTCTLYCMKMFTPRYGKAFFPEHPKRKLELIISFFIKKINAMDEQTKEIKKIISDWEKNLQKQINEEALDTFFSNLMNISKNPAVCELLQDFQEEAYLTLFMEKRKFINTFKNFKETLFDLFEEETIDICKDVLQKLGSSCPIRDCFNLMYMRKPSIWDKKEIDSLDDSEITDECSMVFFLLYTKKQLISGLRLK